MNKKTKSMKIKESLNAIIGFIGLALFLLIDWLFGNRRH